MADELRITNLTAEPGTEPGSVLLRWDLDGDVPAKAQIRVARDGEDTSGTGPWRTFIKPEQKRFTFTKLKGVTYTFNVSVKAGDDTLASGAVSAAPGDAKPAEPKPAKVAVTNLTATGLPGGKVRIDWDVTGAPDKVRVGRDGKDITGYKEWSDRISGRQETFTFTQLKGEYTFTVTPDGGDPVTVKGSPAAAEQPVKVDEPAQPTKPTTPSKPVGNGDGVWQAFTLGAAVYDAANGGFNTAFGKRHGMYGTWGADGKVWAYDTPQSEYGANSVARLGDYDLDVAPQRKLRNGWAGAARGDDDATWRSDITEMKNKWGNRKGKVLYRPFHEFNGNWYPWSVRSTDDQKNFRIAWARLRDIWNDIVGGDDRFQLGWSPNRDSKFGNLKQTFPGKGLVDWLGPDYYDFALRMNDPASAWEAEKNRTQNGDGMVGVLTYIRFAEEMGIPVNFSEWGVQFGDNTNFLGKMLDVFDEYRYDGNGSAAGKIIGGCWHNLNGKSPDPSAGGEFRIVQGTGGFGPRSNIFRMYKNWIQARDWIREV